MLRTIVDTKIPLSHSYKLGHHQCDDIQPANEGDVIGWQYYQIIKAPIAQESSGKDHFSLP